ncbi:MAG: outer membrane beta-barrel protein [bacterium]
MKKLIFAFLALLIVQTISAQKSDGFGIKAGLNYNANGNYIESIEATAQNPDRNIGYHIGVFGKIGGKLYFRPELMYTSTKSDYDSGEFDMKKFDAPLLVGLNVLGPVSVFAGPALQYIVDTDFEGISIDDIDNDFSVGLNFGAAVNFNKFAVDVRYERGFSENEATFLNNNGIGSSRLDTRPDQLILSVSFIL